MTRALDEGGGVGVGDVVGELPAQRRAPSSRARASTPPATIRARSGSNSSRLPRPAISQRLPSACVSASLRKAGLGLAGVDERAERAVRRVVRDPLVLEETDGDRVRPRPWGRLGGGANVHAKARILESLGYAQHRDPQRRPHARRQARRRPLVPARDRARGDRHRGGARARRRRARRRSQHVVMGQVLQAGQGQIPSRQAQIEAGIPKEVPSETINKVCASGVRAAGILDHAIRAGDLEVARRPAAWSRCRNAPYLLPKARFGLRMGDAKALDAMIHDGLTQPVQREADVRGGDRGRRRARDDPRRHGPLGAALARAHDRRDRRRAPAGGDRRR